MKFKDSVIKVVNKIPRGKVMSYGQIALVVGKPNSARQVGFVLRDLSGGEIYNVPWWRVVNCKGELSIKGNSLVSAIDQKELLVSEGVKFEKEFKIDINCYRHNNLIL